MEPEAARLPNGVLFEGRYQILGELGSGSFGLVYRARQLSTGQSVAIKLLSAREGTESSTGREADRFRRETQICAALSHPNIVQLIDSGETQEEELYAVFAHVPGATLAQALADDGALGVREAVRLMTQVLEALGSAHAKGIVHRDLKPANLMLSDAGVRRSALVLDFGLGGLAEGRRRKEWQTLTQTREFLGTPLYAAPEQLAGEAATPRSDLYAWGLIFLECLTGRHPFEAEGAAARLFTGGGAVEIPEWLRGHRLGELLEKVTARDAEKRNVSVESLIEALDAVAGGGELPVAPEESPPPRPLTQSGERRHLTVMFCDLVDSTGLTQRLGTEAYRQVVQAYQARSAEAVERYGGHVVQYLGDGLLVYFGYPQAHEDDAERALRAGREVLRELGTLNPRLEAEHGVTIAARVGIHSGEVVVSEIGGGEKKETLALGDTPTVAARLQGVAEPDTVVISEATLRLVAGLFVTEDRGTPELKGISEPIRVHRVLQPTGLSGRLDRAPALTPFVGREQELGLLLDRFEQAQDQQGQAVLIAGEAGIGKSRLLHRLSERLHEMPHTWLECRSSPYRQQSSFYPVIELVEQGVRSSDVDSTEEKIDQLESALELAGFELAEAVPLFASLLSLRLPERYAPLEISPQLQRQKTLEALLAWVLTLGEKQPVVLVAEDLHWIDPTTLEWLGLVIEQCPTAGVLLVLTFRPDFEPPWSARGHVLPIALNRFSRRQAKELVAAAISGEVLPQQVVDHLAARSDGIPLFVEELAKGVVESGRDLTAPLTGLEIPETLQDSLMARLDRLGEAKQVAQLGAALGREFPYTLLESVAPMKEVALREGLGRLVEAELVYQRGLPPKATYTFKHALVQDTAYASLLGSQRKELHGRIADVLDARLPERVTREPEEIARHCEEAGRTAQAIAHYLRAGKRATQRSANAEAIAHLRRAIALLRTLPETPERNQQELSLQIALGSPLQLALGHGVPEVEETYARALALCRKAGDTPELFPALGGLAMFYRNSDATRAVEVGGELLELAGRTGEVSHRLLAHSMLGNPLYFQGEFSEALAHHEQAIALYDPIEHRALAYVYGVDPGISSLSLASVALWNLGYPERALQRSGRAIELAREGTQPFSLAYALCWDAASRLFRGEPQLVLERTEEAIAISAQRGFQVYLAFGSFLHAFARALVSDSQDARSAIDALAEASNPGAIVGSLPPGLPFFWGLRADAERRLSRLEDALRTANAALALSAELRAPFYDAELHRVKGEIRLAQDPTADEEAENLFLRALSIAKNQEAKSLELRAATSLARLWQRQGNREEARAMLQPVYDWFTEGLDTADLKDTKALLEELS